MKYKHIIFDFNGTLVDSSKVMVEILTSLITKSRFKSLTPKDFETVSELSLIKKIKVLLFFIRYQREFMLMFDKSIGKVDFANGMEEVLRLLNQDNIPFYIISSNATDTIISFFKMHGVFASAIYKSQRLRGKQKAIKRFIRQKKCKPNEVVYISDEIRDAKACNKRGVDMVFVRWGKDKNETLSGCKIKFTADTPADLCSRLL